MLKEITIKTTTGLRKTRGIVERRHKIRTFDGGGEGDRERPGRLNYVKVARDFGTEEGQSTKTHTETELVKEKEGEERLLGLEQVNHRC